MDQIKPHFVCVGYGNAVNVTQMTALMDYSGATSRNTLHAAKAAKCWIDLSSGHRCRCLAILADGRVAALGLSSATILRRISGATDDVIDE